jgi:hypothetical protein
VIWLARRQDAAAMPLASLDASAARGNTVGTRADAFPDNRGNYRPAYTVMCRVLRPAASALIAPDSHFQAECRGFESRLPLF